MIKQTIIIYSLLRIKQFAWMGNVSKVSSRWLQMKKNMLELNEDLKNYDEDSDKWCILQVDLKYSKNLHDLHSALPFLPERMKINKCNQLACNIYDKNYVVHIVSLKQTLDHGLV